MEEKRTERGLRQALVAGVIVLAVLLVLIAIGLGCGWGRQPRQSVKLKGVSKGEGDLKGLESRDRASEVQGTPTTGTRTQVSQVPI